jgi:glycyl-tRNA synthetase (class II)
MDSLLRPETAPKGYFCEFFQDVQKIRKNESSFWNSSNRKAFRNEIVARQFIFRMREFEQMEMQFLFVLERNETL